MMGRQGGSVKQWYQSLIELISDLKNFQGGGMESMYQSLIELISDNRVNFCSRNKCVVSISYRVNF